MKLPRVQIDVPVPGRVMSLSAASIEFPWMHSAAEEPGFRALTVIPLSPKPGFIALGSERGYGIRKFNFFLISLFFLASSSLYNSFLPYELHMNSVAVKHNGN